MHQLIVCAAQGGEGKKHAENQKRYRQNKAAKETETERCMRSSAGTLGVALCASTDCSLHGDERVPKEANAHTRSGQ